MEVLQLKIGEFFLNPSWFGFCLVLVLVFWHSEGEGSRFGAFQVGIYLPGNSWRDENILGEFRDFKNLILKLGWDFTTLP